MSGLTNRTQLYNNMIQERDFVALADEFRAMLGTTPDTMAIVTPTERGIVITPAESNTLGTFYHADKLVDFCRCKSLSCYVTSAIGNGKLITVAHIY